jgi:hypothetical protein
MRKAALILASSFLIAHLLAATAWSYENNPCVRDAYGKIVCPPQGGSCLINAEGIIACSPPYGGIVMNINGQMFCGPGQCKNNARGQAFCSAAQGGSMIFNGSGELVCTGGCVPASASACSWP